MSFGALSMHGVIQQDYARWRAKVGAARAFALEAYTLLFEATKHGLPVDAAVKADCCLATTHAVDTAAEITPPLEMVGGTA